MKRKHKSYSSWFILVVVAKSMCMCAYVCVCMVLKPESLIVCCASSFCTEPSDTKCMPIQPYVEMKTCVHNSSRIKRANKRQQRIKRQDKRKGNKNICSYREMMYVFTAAAAAATAIINAMKRDAMPLINLSLSPFISCSLSFHRLKNLLSIRLTNNQKKNTEEKKGREE